MTSKEEDRKHFDISAYVVQQLGEQLVSDEVTALMELVKNAYDADSKYVRIIIGTKSKLINDKIFYKDHQGYIIIKDGGSGMSKKDLVEGWLTISKSKKREMKAKGNVTTGGRTPLGDKGLGRLSAQRLGSLLEIVTQTSKENVKYHVGFDFSDFREETLLSNVPVKWEEYPRITGEDGTELIILGLHEPSLWEGPALDRFVAKLSQVISPFKDQRPFNVQLTVNNKKINLDTITDKLRNFAISKYQFRFDGEDIIVTGRMKMAKLRGKTDDDIMNFDKLISQDYGEHFYKFLSDPKKKKNLAYHFKLSEQKGWYLEFKRVFKFASLSPSIQPRDLFNKDNKEMFANPGEFSGEIDEFTLESTDEILEAYNNKFDEYKDLVQNQIGIKVFRDGFGIRPFGFDGNDWLKLSKGSTSGGSFYVLRPNNVIGYVALTGAVNKNLQEKTDREGFIESSYSQNFHKIMDSIVKEINGFLQIVRRSYNEFKNSYSTEKLGGISLNQAYSILNNMNAKVPKLETYVNKLGAESKKGSVNVNDVKILIADLKKMLPELDKLSDIVNIIKPRLTKLEEQLDSLLHLASLGMSAEAFSHEMATIADRLSLQTETVLEYLKKRAINDIQLNLFIEYVSSSTSGMREQLKHLSPSLRYLKAKEEIISIKTFSSEIVNYYNALSNSEFKVELLTPFIDYDILINKGKLTQIFDNLFQNSIYWLKGYKNIQHNFNAKIFIKSDAIGKLKIFDNGFGIEPEMKDLIFEPFFTMKPEGRGLGLYIVEKLLDPHSCSIAVQPNQNEHGRLFIFLIDLTAIIH